MLVKDLIRDLQQYPDNADIALQDPSGTALTINSYNHVQKTNESGSVLELHVIAVANAIEPVTSDVDSEEDDDDIPV